MVPNVRTYRALIRMHIRMKDIDSAIALKEAMFEKNLKPDSASFGMIIESLTQRDKIVEALQHLEQSADLGVKIPEKNIRILRARCKNLGISHPHLPPDPKAWVKDLKTTRWNNRHASKRMVQPLQSLQYS